MSDSPRIPPAGEHLYVFVALLLVTGLLAAATYSCGLKIRARMA